MKANKATADELLDKGSDFYGKEKWNQALEYLERANEIYAELGDKEGISIALIWIGNVYLNRGEWGQCSEAICWSCGCKSHHCNSQLAM